MNVSSRHLLNVLDGHSNADDYLERGRLADGVFGTRSEHCDELVTLIRRSAKCYAGLLRANRGGQAG
jgi:hypothetical protein